MAKKSASRKGAPPAAPPPKWFAVMRKTRGLRTGNWAAQSSPTSAVDPTPPPPTIPVPPALCDAAPAEGERQIAEARVGLIHAFSLPACLIVAMFALPVLLRTFVKFPSEVITTLRSVEVVAPFIALLLISGYLNIRSNRFVLTNKRVAFRTGVMFRRQHALFLHEIQDVTVERTLLGRFAKHGTVIVHTPGGDRIALEGLARPESFQRKILDQVEADLARR